MNSLYFLALSILRDVNQLYQSGFSFECSINEFAYEELVVEPFHSLVTLTTQTSIHKIKHGNATLAYKSIICLNFWFTLGTFHVVYIFFHFSVVYLDLHQFLHPLLKSYLHHYHFIPIFYGFWIINNYNITDNLLYLNTHFPCCTHLLCSSLPKHLSFLPEPPFLHGYTDT